MQDVLATYVGLCQLRTKHAVDIDLLYVAETSCSVVIDSTTYLLTISSPDTGSNLAILCINIMYRLPGAIFIIVNNTAESL